MNEATEIQAKKAWEHIGYLYNLNGILFVMIVLSTLGCLFLSNILIKDESKIDNLQKQVNSLSK